MDLSDVMKQRSFVVVGNTHDPKNMLIKSSKRCWRTNIKSMRLAANTNRSMKCPERSISLIYVFVRIGDWNCSKNAKKPFRGVVIQPGASSEALLRYLEDKQIPYLQGCLLKGLQLYKE